MSKPVYERTYEVAARCDDYPGDANQGIVAGGVSHLEKYGVREGELLRVTVTIEKVNGSRPLPAASALEPAPEVHPWIAFYHFDREQLEARHGRSVTEPSKTDPGDCIAYMNDPRRKPRWGIGIHATGKTEAEARISVLELRDLIIRMRDGI